MRRDLRSIALTTALLQSVLASATPPVDRRPAADSPSSSTRVVAVLGEVEVEHHGAPPPTSPHVQPQETPSGIDPEKADVAFTARWTAEEIKWEVVPTTKVRFDTSKGTRTEYTKERDNLPKDVKAGHVYKNVGGRVRVLSQFPDVEQLAETWQTQAPPKDANKDSHTAGAEKKRQ